MQKCQKMTIFNQFYRGPESIWGNIENHQSFCRCFTLWIFYIQKNLRWYYFISRPKNLLQNIKCLKTTAFSIFLHFQGLKAIWEHTETLSKNVEKLKFPVIFVYFQGPSNYWRKY